MMLRLIEDLLPLDECTPTLNFDNLVKKSLNVVPGTGNVATLNQLVCGWMA
jgi:hypothetical protein